MVWSSQRLPTGRDRVIVLGVFVHLSDDLANFRNAKLVCILVFLWLRLDHVDFIGLDDTISLGLHLLPEALLGNIEESITFGIDPLYEFREILGPAVPTGQRTQSEG